MAAEQSVALEAWGTALLAFARVVTVFVQAPIFGSQHFKAPVKVGMAASVVLLAMPSLPIPHPFPADPRGFIFAILTQICVGLVIGWDASTSACKATLPA